MKNFKSAFGLVWLLGVFLLPHTVFAAASPGITTQPQSQSVVAGSNTVFSVIASGSAPLVYQWAFNGVNLMNSSHISGATASTLTLSNTVAVDAGSYQVVVTNTHGSATSSVAVLTVFVPPFITMQPSNQTAYIRGSAAFSVAASGTAPLSYRWLFNGTTLSDNGQITGSTTATLAIVNLQTTNFGSYGVIVTNNYGSITSIVATLAVTNRTYFVNVDNTSPAAPYTNWGTAAANIQDAVDMAVSGETVLVTNGVYQSGMRIASGTIANRLAVTKPLIIRSVNGPDVTVILGNPAMGDGAVRCVYLCSNAVLNGFQLLSGSTRTNGDANLDESGGGAWCQDGSVVVSNCEFQSCSAYNNGGGAIGGTFYNCFFKTNFIVVGNGGGVEGGTLAGCTFAGNAADGFGSRGGGVHGCAVVHSTFINNTAFYGAAAESSTLTNCLISANSASVIGGAGNICDFYSCLITNNTAGYMAGGASYGTSWNCVFVGNSSGNTCGAVSSATLNNCLVFGNSAGVGGGAGFYSVLNNCTVVGNSADNYGGGVDTVTANNCVIVGNSAPAAPNYSSATLNYCDTSPMPTNGAGNFTNAPVFADANAGDFRLYPGSPGIDAGNNTYAAGGMDLAGNPRIVNGVVDLGAYELQNTPFIVVQPTNQTVAYGTPSVSFSVGAVVGTLTYQWRFNGTNITGATNATLTLNDVQFASAGIYSVVVMNAFGAVASFDAVLTVVETAPVITVPPASQTVFIGNTLNLSVTAFGSPSLRYQWQFNGNPMISATNRTLTVVGMTEGQAGSYQVVVSDGAGATSSGNAVVLVPEVVSWGYVGSTNVPAGLTNVFQIGAGYFASWAFLTNGAMSVWSSGSAFIPTTGNTNVVRFGVGANFAEGLFTDGRVLFYGYNLNGEGNLPPDLTNIVALATGPFHSVAAREDGTVAAWGPDWYGMTDVPAGLTNVTAVAAAYYNSFALKSDGTVVAWGDNTAGQCNVPAGLTNVVALAPEDDAVYALKSDGTVVEWGAGPPPPAGLSNVVDIAASGYHVTALKADGSVATWGANPYGETNAPAGLTNVLQIASGYSHSTVLMGQPQPRVMQQPFSATVLSGGRTAFFARVLGRQPLHYQWQLNGTNVPGAVQPGFLLENIRTNNAGNYTLVVTNAFGAVTSVVASLTVNLPPAITAQPQSQTAVAGNDAYFSVSVQGTPPLAYQWYFNGSAINGDPFIGYRTATLGVSPVQTNCAGNYYVVITNTFGSVTSAVASMAVVVRPQMEVPPQSQAVAVGNNIVLSATVTGTQPISYQWYFNGIPLADGTRVNGSTSNVLTITGAQFSDAGGYQLAVTNVAGGGISFPATISVLMPPAVTLQPVGQTAMQGSNVTLFTAVSGDPPLSYQWFYNGTPLADGGQISGAMTTNLMISNIQFTNGGNYVLVVTNPVGSATSVTAALTVVSSPVIAQQPADQNVLQGSNGVFSATVIGTQPIGVQWFFNNSPLIDDGRISGATTTTLTMGNLQTNDAGGYFILATNAYGSVTSVVVNLNVILPVTFTQSPSNQIVAVGSNLVLNASADGSTPIGYRWFFNNSPLSDGARVTGSATAMLTVSNAQTSDAGNYFAVATNLLSSATSAVAAVTVMTKPAITLQPISHSTPLGLSNSLTAAASGSAPLAYQWMLNGTNIPNATNTTYAIQAIGTNDFGVYQFVASNTVGTAASSNTSLTIGPVAAWGYNIYNQCVVPPGLSNVVSIAGGNNLSLVTRLDGSIVAWGSVSSYTNSSFTNLVAVAAGYGGAVGLRANGTITGSSAMDPSQYKVFASNAVAVAAGYNFAFALRVEGTVIPWGYFPGTVAGPAVANPPAGLSHVTAISAGYQHVMALRNDGTVVAWGAGLATNVPVGLSNVVAIAAGTLHSLALKSDGTVVAWGTGAGTNVPPGLSNVVAISAANYFDQRSSLSFAVKSNGTVVGWGLSPYSQTNIPSGLTNVVAIAGSSYHELALVNNDGAPMIISAPVGGTVWSGNDEALRVAAVGTAPLHCQWLFNGTNIDGATNATLTIPSVQQVNAGSYQVVVSNAVGTAASLPVPVNVIDGAPFLLTVSSTNSSGFLGNKFSLNAAAGGSGPLHYQWNFNGTNIFGATNDSLMFGRLHLTNAGNYTVVITNGFGAITSAVIKLTVKQVVVWGDASNGTTNMPPGLTNVIAIDANFYNNIVLRADGTLAIWGNSFGLYVPTNSVAGVSNVVEVSAGYNQELVLKSNGRPYMWGSGISSSTTNAVAAQSNIVAVVATSSSTGCALLRADGVLVQIMSSSVVTNSGVTNGIALAANDDGYFVLRADGSVYSYAGGLGGARPTNVIALAAGRYQGLALKRDGTVTDLATTWPGVTNLSGIIGVASTYSGPEFALRSDGSIVMSTNIVFNGATNVPYAINSVQVLDAGYSHCLALLSDRDFPPVFLHTALNTTNYVVSSKGSAQWFGQTNVSHDGVSAAQSAAIGNNTATSMRTWVYGPTSAKFWCKVSSAPGHGVLNVSAGGTVLTNISGEVDWQQITVNIPPGGQILQWTYAKDGAPAAGQDAAWVDQLQYTNIPPTILTQPAPAAQSVIGGTNITASFTLTVAGTPPYSYNWVKDGQPFLSQTNGSPNSLVFTNVTRTNSGTYFVIVNNMAGSVTSSNVVLDVRVPQLLGSPTILPDGTLTFSSTDADGGLLSSNVFANLQLQATTNLVDWVTLSDALIYSNGVIYVQDSDTNSAERFYRLIEN